MDDMHALDGTLLQALGAIEVLLHRAFCSAAELSGVRYQIARAVAARRKAIDRLVNGILLEGGAPAEGAKSLRGGSLDMRMFYTDHISAWPTARAIEHWPAYVVASKKLAEVIRRQVQIERELLYPGVPPVPA